MIESINPAGVPKPMSSYANAAWGTGTRTLHIAGQVGVTESYQPSGDGGAEAQVRQTFTNIRLIVEAAGGSLADIVALTIYVTDIAHAEAVNRVRSELFSAPLPASTLVQVVASMHPSLVVEISAVAVLA